MADLKSKADIAACTDALMLLKGFELISVRDAEAAEILINSWVKEREDTYRRLQQIDFDQSLFSKDDRDNLVLHENDLVDFIEANLEAILDALK